MLTHFQVDELRVFVLESRREMGGAAGSAAASAIKKTIREKGRANVLFAAAPSQRETLAALRADREIDWTKVYAFHMDEYIGLDRAHPAGFGNFLKREFFDRVPLAGVYLIDGGAADLEEETARYAALLGENPLDVCLCGIGENGHIAFNDPPVANFRDPAVVKVVTLDEVCRAQQVHDGCFAALDEVPRQAITVTVPGIIAAAAVICTVPACSKADAVRRMLREPVAEKVPASILRRHTCAGLYLEPDSARYILPQNDEKEASAI